MALDADKAKELARDAYTASTSYFDSSIRRGVEGAIRQFRGDHPTGSKYLSEAYASRSKIFRPKTRAMVTRAESTAAEAFFATQDAVTILPWDEDDETERVSADINKMLLEYRLMAKHPMRCIPWYLTVIAAYQEAMVNGVICSRQFWEYNKKRLIDRPMVDLVPIENIRFDPNAKWSDPVNTTPYWIELIPMYVKDVRAKAEEANQFKRWINVEPGELQNATKQNYDSTRQTREGPQRTDPRQETTAITEYSIVWVHRNIVEWNGDDYIYYTLGTEKVLSRVMKLRDEYWHGRRPYTMGFAAIEAHKTYPSSPVMLVRDLQAEGNDVVNLRLDNVKFVLSKRYFVKRNAQVDLRSLTRNTVGSATLMKDPEKDVKVVDFNDVTSSAYQEQDRINLDFDEMGGTFSSSSVSSNRKLNETVGGMNLLAADTNAVGNYRLRTFVETWAEPTIAQIVLLEQKYETDDVVMAIAGRRSRMYQRYGQNRAIDAFLDKDLALSVNVGFGPTNPAFQLERFMAAMRQFKEILQDNVLRNAGIDIEEVKKEIFGKLGYRDGRRFFVETDNPEVASLMQEIQALEQQLAAKESPEERTAKVAKTNAEANKITQEAEKVRLEVQQLSAGEHPQVSAAMQQLSTAQQDFAAKEQEWNRERDALELRLADKSDTAEHAHATESERIRSEDGRHQRETDAKVRIAEIERERAAELAKVDKNLANLTSLVKDLAKEVAAATKAAEQREKDEQRAETTKTDTGKPAPQATVVVLDSGAGGAREITLTEGKNGELHGTIKSVGGKS